MLSSVVSVSGEVVLRQRTQTVVWKMGKQKMLPDPCLFLLYANCLALATVQLFSCLFCFFFVVPQRNRREIGSRGYKLTDLSAVFCHRITR